MISLVIVSALEDVGGAVDLLEQNEAGIRGHQLKLFDQSFHAGSVQPVRLIDNNEPDRTVGRTLAAQREELGGPEDGAVQLMAVQRLDGQRPLKVLEALQLAGAILAEPQRDAAGSGNRLRLRAHNGHV